MLHQFSRTELLFGEKAMQKLAASRVAVFGLGGVGGYAVEALVRSGIGSIDLIDNDTVALTNLNRQIIATHQTIGMYKTDAAEQRIAAINPACIVRKYQTFFLPETKDMFDFTQYDYIIDAIDTVTAKLSLAECAITAGVPIISCMGTGNKLDPTALEVTDIFKTSVCPLARVMRQLCKKRGIRKLKVVYSKEQPVTLTEKEQFLDEHSRSAEAKNNGRRDIPGSAAFVPPAAGLILASEVVRGILSDTNAK